MLERGSLLAVLTYQTDEAAPNVSNSFCSLAAVLATLEQLFRCTWSAKHTDKFAGRTPIVTDWDDVAERAMIRLTDVVEDIYEVVGL